MKNGRTIDSSIDLYTVLPSIWQIVNLDKIVSVCVREMNNVFFFLPFFWDSLQTVSA